ncbi:hypothetical protein RUM44_004907 [Polyplax serrata]|uniref:Uncharacterized protein n=1 Tax=Polyplax serrata TaxID=468196 RepID=A0ABR1B454_POLSC
MYARARGATDIKFENETSYPSLDKNQSDGCTGDNKTLRLQMAQKDREADVLGVNNLRRKKLGKKARQNRDVPKWTKIHRGNLQILTREESDRNV